MTDDEIIALVQAHKEGKQIQKLVGPGTMDGFTYPEWTDDNDPIWDFNRYVYRIKPEPRKPREWWAEVYPDGSGRLYSDTRSLTKGCGEIIRVTEQLQPDKVWCS